MNSQQLLSSIVFTPNQKVYCSFFIENLEERGLQVF